jgi:hypothetical protein
MKTVFQGDVLDQIEGDVPVDSCQDHIPDHQEIRIADRYQPDFFPTFDRRFKGTTSGFDNDAMSPSEFGSSEVSPFSRHG